MPESPLTAYSIVAREMRELAFLMARSEFKSTELESAYVSAMRAIEAVRSARRWTFEEASNHVFRWCNSYERLPVVLSLRGKMAAPDWWRLLGEQWTCFDNVAEYKERLRTYLLRANAKNLSAMMTEDEHLELAAMPDVLTVYRGCYQVNADGLSWSLDRKIAAKIPSLSRYRRQNDTPLLLQGKVKKSRAVLMLGRNEQEIVSPAVEVESKQLLG